MRKSMDLKTPRIGSPFCTAKLLFIRRTAPAPSLTWLAFPKNRNENIYIYIYSLLMHEMK
jgi:hypothetical protein